MLASSVYFVAALASVLAIGAMRKGNGYMIHPGALSLLSMVLFYIVAVSSFNVEVVVAPASGGEPLVYGAKSWGLLGVGLIGGTTMLLYTLAMWIGAVAGEWKEEDLLA